TLSLDDALLILALRYGKSQEERGTDANHDRAEEASRHTERTRQIWFAHSQNDQGQKLQHQADAVDKDVDRDQAFEAQTQAKRPANGAHRNRYPGGTGSRMHFAENTWKHAVLRHGEGKPRVTHYQSIKHSERAHHAAGD